jgi:hypothetical protein
VPQEIFMATVSILSVLVKSDEGALHVARSAPGAMKLWEGICQLLGRKMDMERKYIERLEGAVCHACSSPTAPQPRLDVADSGPDNAYKSPPDQAAARFESSMSRH